MPQYLSNLTKEEIALLVPLVGLAGVFFGSFISSFFPFLTSLLARRNEERRQFRQMAIQAGLDNWKHQNELAIGLIKTTGKGNYTIDAPDDYIIHMLLLMGIASDPKLSPEEATAMIARKSRKPKPANPDAPKVA